MIPGTASWVALSEPMLHQEAVTDGHASYVRLRGPNQLHDPSDEENTYFRSEHRLTPGPLLQSQCSPEMGRGIIKYYVQ